MLSLIKPGVSFFLIASLVASACLGCGHRKLDESVFYDSPVFKLKVVRYYENLPLHYTGEVFRVQCSSPQTADSPGRKMQDPGWVTIGGGGAIGSTSAEELVTQVELDYLVMDENTLVWSSIVLSASFDACGTFRHWDPSTLGEELIDPVEKPDYCAPSGTADCRYYDFMGERQPHYDDIEADDTGFISFRVRSTAFRDGAVLHVQSDDFGNTWQKRQAE